MKPLLTICKPTYNRKNVLIPDLKSYCAYKDMRLRFKISDNCSTDGTAEEIILLQKEDNRVVYSRCEKNIGATLNCMASLKGANSEYIMLVIDKDTVDMAYMPNFLDYLEKEKPYYGYVDLSNNQPYHVDVFPAGFQAMKHVGFLSKHPSGFFWRTDLFEQETEKAYFKKVDKSFDFIYDLTQGMLGSQYPGSIVYLPLIINANLRPKDSTNEGKSYTYNEDNFYFGRKQRENAFIYYIQSVFSSNVEISVKKQFFCYQIERFICAVTISLQQIYANESVCRHYNLIMRKITFKEMMHNSREIICIGKRLAKNANVSIHPVFYVIIRMKNVLRILRYHVKKPFRSFSAPSIK